MFSGNVQTPTASHKSASQLYFVLQLTYLYSYLNMDLFEDVCKTKMRRGNSFYFYCIEGLAIKSVLVVKKLLVNV